MNSPIVVIVIMILFIIISVTIVNLKVNGTLDRFFDWFKRKK